MNVSEVLDIKPSENTKGQPIHPGDHFTVKGFETKMVESVGAKWIDRKAIKNVDTLSLNVNSNWRFKLLTSIGR